MAISDPPRGRKIIGEIVNPIWHASCKGDFSIFSQLQQSLVPGVVLKIDTTDSNEIPFLNGGITQKSFRK